MQIALGSTDSLFFSSSIPFLQISPDPEVTQYTISLTTQNSQLTTDTIFTTSLYIPGFFQFDIRSIITAHMEARRLAFASYTITLTTLNSQLTTDNQNSTLKISVLYARGTFPGSASEFTQSYFLTSAQSRPLPLYNAFDSLSLYSESEGVADVEILYTTDTGTFTTIKQFAYSSGLSRIDIDFEQIISDYLSQNSHLITQNYHPVAATVTAGGRVMRYWFMRMHQAAAISFLNTFYCPEHFWIFGSWKRTGKISQQSAYCASEACAHTLDIDPEFEITTHPIGFRQAYIIPEISMSPIVWAYLFTDGSSLAKAAFKAIPVNTHNSQPATHNSLAASTFKAVPTEGSLEASPQDKNFTQYTFKVIAAEKQYALGFNFDIPRIFTRQFSPEFT